MARPPAAGWDDKGRYARPANQKGDQAGVLLLEQALKLRISGITALPETAAR